MHTCRTVWYSTVQYGTVWYSTVWYSTVQYITVWYSTVQHNTVQYSMAQYSTVQYGAYIRHSTFNTEYIIVFTLLKNIDDISSVGKVFNR